MARKMEVIRDNEYIYEMISDKSAFIKKYMKENHESNFILYYKYLTHSDLPTFGKATKPNSLEKNLLYYLTVDEMKEIEQRNNRPFETAHQSNISLPSSFWDDIGMENPRINVTDNNSDKSLNNFASIYLVNDSMRYFTNHYTTKVFRKLNKNSSYCKEWTLNNTEVYINYESELTKINLTQAVHGIGIKTDIEFHKLRRHMFKNDILYLLIEIKKDNNKNLFVIPTKNPSFFTIIGESNNAWEEYMIEEQRKLESIALREQFIGEKETQIRLHQDKWRRMLAEEMMNYTTNDDEVFCPLTWISADFNKAGTVFRASHIKSFADSSDSEKYDINNGLLLVANADALFDKHLLTIDNNKELIFSFLIKNDRKLITQLLLNQPIFKDVLNENRMKYLSEHRAIFESKEKIRKEK